MLGRSSLVWLVLLVGGLLYGLYATSGQPDVDQTNAQQPLLEGRRVGEATRIVIRSQPQVAPIEIEQEAGGVFLLREPLRDELSRGWFEAFAQSWNSAMAQSQFAPDQIDAKLLEQTGLDEPRAEVSFHFDATTLRFELGETGPLGYLFVRRDGAIYRAPAGLFSSIQGTPDDLRERVVFRHDPRQIARLQFERRLGDGTMEQLVLERRGGDYRIVAPVDVAADVRAAQALLARMLGLRAESFVRGNVRDDFDTADFVVAVDGERGAEKVSLWREVSGSLTGVHHQRGIAFTLSARVADSLFAVTAEDLRSRVLIPFVVDDLRSVRLDPGAGKGVAVELARGNDNVLALRAPVEAAANPSAVIGIFRGLRRLGAIEFVTAAPTDLDALGLGEDAFTLEVVGPTDARPTTLRFGADVAAAGGTDKVLTYVYAPRDTLVVKVPKAAVDELRVPWQELIALEVYRNDRPIEIGRVVYQRGEATAAYVRGEDGRFRPEGGDQVREEVAEIVDKFCALRGKRAVPDAEVPGDGHVEVSLQRRNGDEIRRLTLVAAGQRVYARQSRLAVWFELSSLDGGDLLILAPQ